MRQLSVIRAPLRSGVLAAAVAVSPAAAGPDLLETVQTTFGLRSACIVSLETTAGPGEAFTAALAIDGRPCTLELVPRSVRAPGFRVWHQEPGGALRAVDPGPVRTLRGSVPELPGSRVAGALLETGLHLLIDRPGAGRLWLQPLAPHVAGGAPGDHVLYPDDAVIPSGGTCGNGVASGAALARAPAGVARDLPGAAGSGPAPDTAPAPGTAHGAAASGGGGGVAGQLCYHQTELACDADFPYFDDWGDETEARIETIINTVNLQYEAQTEITHLITAIVVRTSPEDDPYTATNPSQLLAQFRVHWEADHDDVPRDVAHLFTGRNLDGSVIGIAATLGGICTDLGYCLSQSDCCNPNFPCATDLTAHELGHLWGAGHCDCVGWTMNPFITCANQFTDGSVISIVNHRDSRTCLLPFCILQESDSCATPIVVEDMFTWFTNVGADTDGFPEPDCFLGEDQIESDVWFRYTATCDGLLIVRLCSSGFDTRLAVYAMDTCPDGPGQAFTCNDDHCLDRSEVEIVVEEGLELLIRAGGRGAAQGQGTLGIAMECGAFCPADVNDDGEVDVDDLTALVLAWDSADPDADVNNDGIVDVLDLTMLVLAWGECPRDD